MCEWRRRYKGKKITYIAGVNYQRYEKVSFQTYLKKKYFTIIHKYQYLLNSVDRYFNVKFHISTTSYAPTCLYVKPLIH